MKPGWPMDDAVPGAVDFGTEGSIDSFGESHAGAHASHPISEAESDDLQERYEIRALLGSGGMGRVHLAWDRRLKREVAIKVPTDANGRARFAREAAITALLEHPGIVPVFDAGRAMDGTPWFAMPIVRGRSLATLTREADGLPGRLRLLRHVLAVAETLAFAHSQGAVHRDVKPTNVMVGRFGETQVIDWGLAHVEGLGDVAKRAGTPRYMSPEQAAGAPPDPRDDVYSLGALLFETVCGMPAFPDVQTAADIVPAPPQRAPVPDGVPVELIAIIDHALAPERASRYADARALASDLDNYLAGRIVTAHAYSRVERVVRFVRRWRLPLGIAGLALVTLIIVGAMSVARIADARRDAEENLSLTLVTAANAALAQENRDDALRLARYALSLKALPDARGVLMALPDAVGIQRTSTPVPLDGCQPKAVDSDALQVLCVSDDAPGRVSLRNTDETLWHIEADASHGATFVADGDMVALVSPREVDFRWTRDGTRRALMRPECRGTMQPGSRTDALLLFRRTCASMVTPDQEMPMPVAACGVSGVAAAAIDQHARRFALACHDGTLHMFAVARNGPTTLLNTFDAHLRPPGLGVSAVAFADADSPLLLVGTQQGALLKVDMNSRTRLGLITPGGYVDTIRVTPDGRFALVDQHTGPQVLVDVPAFARLAQLPADVVTAALTRTGARHLAGNTLRHDDSAPPVARHVSMSHGVTSLAISPDGRILAVGQSDWLTTVDTGTRRPMGRVQWQHEVVKSLDYTRNGTLVAHGIGDPSTMWFDEPTLVSPRREALGSKARRIVVLPDGSILHGRWRVETLRRVRQGVNPDENAGPAMVDIVGLDGGRLVYGVDGAGVVWRAENLHDGGRFEPCGDVPGGLAMAGWMDGDTPVVLVMRAHDIVGACGNAAHFTTGPDETPRDASALTALAGAAGWVAAGSRDGLVRLWHIGAPLPHAIQRNHTSRIAAVAMDPKGRWFATGGWDAQVMFWTIPNAETAADARDGVAPTMAELLEILRRAR